MGEDRARPKGVGFRLLVLVLAAVVPAQVSARGRKVVGEIEFFGYKRIDIAAVQRTLPFHEGDVFPPAGAKSSDVLKRRVADAVKQAIGREPTSVSFVCCDAKQDWMIYIGLPGESYRGLAFNPPPSGEARLPKSALALRERMDSAWMNAMMKGHATEDDSEGYTLTNEPKARAAELAVRNYAVRNEELIRQVLSTSSDARHRAVAAGMLGYGHQSDEQLDALVHAGLDADDGVRNDAIRALEVLAGAKPELVRRIPPEPFVRLLRSSAWSDHNKASLLLLALTKSRDAAVLAALREQALDSLIEMARWRNPGHAEAACLILGRIAGIEEQALDKLIEAGQVDSILDKLITR